MGPPAHRTNAEVAQGPDVQCSYGFDVIERAGPLALYFRAEVQKPTETEEFPWIGGSFSVSSGLVGVGVLGNGVGGTRDFATRPI